MARCLLHSHATGSPGFFRVSLLSPSSLSHPSSSSSSSSLPSPSLLQLLGLSDQELQEQMVKSHSYAFKYAYNMGNSYVIPFQDFKEAVEALMERNMPDVLQNRQTEVASVSQCNAMHCNGESVRRQGVQSVHKQQPVTWQQNAQYLDNRNSSVIAGRVRQDYTESWFWVVLKRKFQTWVEVAKLAWTVVK